VTLTEPTTGTEAPPVRLLSGDDVDALATVEVGLAAAEDAARLVTAGRITTGRVQVNGPVAWMRILAGTISDLDLLGYKEFHRVGRRVKYHVHLFRESTGDALGIVDGRRITSLRTSATAAAAVRHWAGDRRVRVGLIGSGEEAREGLRAIHGAVPVERALVFSPTPANRTAFADQMGAELDLAVTATDSQAGVLAGCDVLYVATSSHHTAFLSGRDVADIGLVAAIGSTQPVHRELFGDVFSSADAVVVDTPDATHESGDCIEAVAAGWDASSVQLLGNYLGTTPGAATGRTVFKSIGSVEQDLVLAHHLLRAAEEQDRGTLVDPVGSLRLMR
jgi:ornithine cyclodeaminase/alanine dehydrogenase-like protein (mu-crystallin family)